MGSNAEKADEIRHKAAVAALQALAEGARDLLLPQPEAQS